MGHKPAMAAIVVSCAWVMSLAVAPDYFSNARTITRPVYSGTNQATHKVPAAAAANTLEGEWRVSCEARTYQNGQLQGSYKDEKESLVVAESDPDGSYYVYKFPAGLSEGVPRLRKVADNRYEGEDTVKGIEYTVRQSVQIEGDRVSITQRILGGSSGAQLQSETTCIGSRDRGILKIEPSNPTPQLCASEPSSGELPDQNIARRYKSVRPFSDGLAAVATIPRGSRTLKWGFIDRTGRIAIPLRYDVVSSFHDGLAAVAVSYGHGRNLKWGIVEKLGPQVTPHVNFDAVKILGGGFAAVGYVLPGRPGLKWNLTNREYNLIFHGFDDIGCFVGDQARASYTEGTVVRTFNIDRAGNVTPRN